MSHINIVVTVLLIILISVLAPTPVKAENEYCVVCRDGRRFKTPDGVGGEVGRVWVGTQNPNCQVSYYDGRTCHETPPRR